MLKKLLAGLTALALSLGMVALSAAPASAHQGDIDVTSVCNTQTGNYDLTYTLSWSSVPDGVQAQLWSRTGTTSFQNGWGLGAWNDWVDRGMSTGGAGSIQWTATLPGTTDGNGPWVYAYTDWNNDYEGSTRHDTRVEGLQGDCRATVTPVAPTFTSAQCTGPGTYGLASYTIPAVTGVQYQKSPNGTSSWSDIAAGNHTTAANSTIYLRAVAKPGYTLAGNPSSYKWSKDFDAPNCTYDATPVAPTFTSAQCTGPGTYGQAGYTIPVTVGVKYEVRFATSGGWTETTAGTYPIAANGYIEVRAVALPNYQLKNYPGTWKKQFSPPNCTVTVTPTKPVLTQAVCTAEGQVGGAGYTIPSITGAKYQRWNGNSWVDVAPGTYPAADGSEVWIRAVDLPGHDLAGNDDNYVWKLEFTNVDSRKCVVPADATSTPSRCTGPGTSSQASYTIPTDSGIQYQRWDGAQWVNVDAGIVNVNSFPTTVQLRAIAKPGYTVVGGPFTWTFDFAAPGDCLEKVVPSDPTFTDSVCEANTTGATQGGYFIPTTANVAYTVSLNSAPAAPATTGAFVPTNPGDTVKIEAVAAPGYTLSPYTGPWSHTFAAPGDCLDEVAVGAVTKVDQTCIVIDDVSRGGKFGALVKNLIGVFVEGWITIPATPHVDYFLAPDLVTPLTAGDHELPPGTYTVHAVAHPGYVLTGYDGPWVLEIVAAEACGDLVDLPVVTPQVTFVQATCVAAGSYTLAVEEPGLEAGVIWTVTGGLPTTLGTHAVATAGLVTVTATPAPGYGFPGSDPSLEWQFTFVVGGDCLPTLALTGQAPLVGGLGLAALLTLGGILLIGTRERVGRPE